MIAIMDYTVGTDGAQENTQRTSSRCRCYKRHAMSFNDWLFGTCTAVGQADLIQNIRRENEVTNTSKALNKGINRTVHASVPSL